MMDALQMTDILPTFFCLFLMTERRRSRLFTHNRDMDKEFTQGKMHNLLKPEDQRHPPLGQVALANQWGSVESDTESLAQERAYQQQLRKCHGHYDFLQNESADSLDKVSKREETEDLQFYDSLEVGTHTHVKNENPVYSQTEYLETQPDERERRR